MTFPSESMPCGPIRGCHMAGEKCSMTVREKNWKKNSLAGPPNLVDHAKLGHRLHCWDMDSAIANYREQTIC
jgi:hypothetical protein